MLSGMARRTNPYEAAFEDLLRQDRTPYVAVDEARRSLVAGGSLKSLDFLVSPPGSTGWLVDIKGRQFPAGTRRKQYWRNWTTRDDLRSLAEWGRHFGPSMQPVLVFAYHIVGDRSPLPEEELHAWGGEWYAFVAVPLAEYLVDARPLSRRWDTVSLPTPLFRQRARSWRELLATGAVEVGAV